MRLLLLALLGLCCLTACTVEGVGSEVPERSVCLKLTRKHIPIDRIKTYMIKEGSRRAVILFTKRGMKVCADPEDEWVKSAVREVDRKTTARRSELRSSPSRAQQPTNTAGTPLR